MAEDRPETLSEGSAHQLGDEAASRQAQAIREALAEADADALIQGSVQGRCTLIDGNFDLLAVAASVLGRLGTRIESLK